MHTLNSGYASDHCKGRSWCRRLKLLNSFPVHSPSFASYGLGCPTAMCCICCSHRKWWWWWCKRSVARQTGSCAEVMHPPESGSHSCHFQNARLFHLDVWFGESYYPRWIKPGELRLSYRRRYKLIIVNGNKWMGPSLLVLKLNLSQNYLVLI